jgi:hypothetical protein
MAFSTVTILTHNADPNGRLCYVEFEHIYADLEDAAQCAMKHQPAILYAARDIDDPSKGSEVYMYAHDYVIHVHSTDGAPRASLHPRLKRLAMEYIKEYHDTYLASYYKDEEAPDA